MLDAHDDDGHIRTSLGLYAMGALGEDQCVEIDAHIEDCAVCREELRSLQEVVTALAVAFSWDCWTWAGIGTEPADPTIDGCRRSIRTQAATHRAAVSSATRHRVAQAAGHRGRPRAGRSPVHRPARRWRACVHPRLRPLPRTRHPPRPRGTHRAIARGLHRRTQRTECPKWMTVNRPRNTNHRRPWPDRASDREVKHVTFGPETESGGHDLVVVLIGFMDRPLATAASESSMSQWLYCRTVGGEQFIACAIE